MLSTVLEDSTPKSKVERTLILDTVIGEGAAILKLLTSEDQALLVGGL